MAGLDPAIHVFLRYISIQKTWMPGARPGMINNYHLALRRWTEGVMIREKANR
jgi:hypothetical protein